MRTYRVMSWRERQSRVFAAIRALQIGVLDDAYRRIGVAEQGSVLRNAREQVARERRVSDRGPVGRGGARAATGLADRHGDYQHRSGHRGKGGVATPTPARGPPLSRLDCQPRRLSVFSLTSQSRSGSHCDEMLLQQCSSCQRPAVARDPDGSRSTS